MGEGNLTNKVVEGGGEYLSADLRGGPGGALTTVDATLLPPPAAPLSVTPPMSGGKGKPGISVRLTAPRELPNHSGKFLINIYKIRPSYRGRERGEI